MVIADELKSQIRKTYSDPSTNKVTGDTTEIEITTYQRPEWQAIDIDFLSSYYSQDGNHSAVTGGLGTEQLTDFTQKVIVNVPITQKLKINVDGGYDYYSSASTDNIDNVRSSASSVDMRVHGNIGTTIQLNPFEQAGFRIGGSGEYDYTSLSIGANYLRESKDRNSAIAVSLQAFIDQWVLYYPRELRRRGPLVPTNKRQSYNAAVSWTQVLNRKMQFSLQLEGTYMNGLLSTPFHRVYFADQEEARVEQLPSTRLKLPVGLRLNTHVSEWLISRMYYRYYWDDWGVKGHTASIELPIKINRFVAVFPYYRYHTQNAADYFLPIDQHVTSSQFYTSDFDLAALSSHSYGIGMSVSPVDGLAKTKLPFVNQSLMIKSVDLKVARYTRSTDLKSYIVSLGVSLKIGG